MVFAEGPPVNRTERGLVRFWDQHQARYCTWADAEQGHREIVDALRASLKMKDTEAAIVMFDARIAKAIRGLVRR